MAWLEGLAQDDWRMFHSDSEVQEIARNAFELLKEQQETIKRLQDKLFANPDAWIHCKDCKWHDNPDESTKWLPCMEIRTLNNWFCAYGKRKET